MGLSQPYDKQHANERLGMDSRGCGRWYKRGDSLDFFTETSMQILDGLTCIMTYSLILCLVVVGLEFVCSWIMRCYSIGKVDSGQDGSRPDSRTLENIQEDLEGTVLKLGEVYSERRPVRKISQAREEAQPKVQGETHDVKVYFNVIRILSALTISLSIRSLKTITFSSFLTMKKRLRIVLHRRDSMVLIDTTKPRMTAALSSLRFTIFQVTNYRMRRVYFQV